MYGSAAIQRHNRILSSCNESPGSPPSGLGRNRLRHVQFTLRLQSATATKTAAVQFLDAKLDAFGLLTINAAIFFCLIGKSPLHIFFGIT